MKIKMEKIENRICCDHGGTSEIVTVEEVECSNCRSTNTPLPGVPDEDRVKGDADGCKLQNPTSNSAGVNSDTFNDSSSKVSSPRIVTGDGSCMAAEVLRHSFEGIAPVAEISAENVTGESSNPREGEEQGISERKICQKKTNADVSSSVFMADVHNRQLRTVPSSLYSKTVPSPVSSSNDGCQDASFEADLSTIDKKNREEHAAKNALLEMAEDGSLTYWKKIMKQQPDKQTDLYITSQLSRSASIRLIGKRENLGKTSQDLENCRSDDVARDAEAGTEEKLAIAEKNDCPIQKRGQKSADLMTGRDSEMELTYELEDALEVARWVAKEVEREVGIYREASGSSLSVEDRNDKTMLLSNADSSELKRSDCLKEIGDRSESRSCCSTKEDMNRETSAGNRQLFSEAKDLYQGMSSKVPETDDGLCEHESSQLTTAPEARLAMNGRPCLPSFDLNEDVQTEEVECAEKSVTLRVPSCYAFNLSVPIPVVATSRGPACLPKTPLHFEGELGWRGSAATSAFRPALLCKTDDKEMAGSVEENNGSSKGFLDIDLNVADTGDDSVVELFPRKHFPQSLTILSGDSSAEDNSKRAERLNLDLNRLDDNDDNCSDLLPEWKMEFNLHPGRNGAHSPSLSSTSRPVIRDFDLNDNPSFSEAHNVHRLVHGIWSSRNMLLDDRSDSVLGSTMHLNSTNVKSGCLADSSSVQDSVCDKDCLYSPQPLFMARPKIFPSVEQMGSIVAAQPTLRYAQPPGFFHNGYGVGPMFPLPSVVYSSGAVPYMVDSCAATIIPQLLGPSALSSFPGASYLNIAGTPCGNDVGILRPNVGLSAGITSLETESQGGNGRNLFFPANSNLLMEDQMKSFQQAARSSPSRKRKEPESGLESYQIGYRQMTSWH